MAAGWLAICAGWPVIPLLLSVIRCSRPCYFFGNSAFDGHFLHVALYFPCYLQTSSHGLRSGALALCTECIAFDKCAMSNNSNQHFGVCQTVKKPKNEPDR
jgi:hypothetical protein